MQKILFTFVAIFVLGLAVFGQTAPLGDYMSEHMQTSNIIAGSSTPDPTAPGGFGASNNFPKNAKGQDFTKGEVTLTVKPDEEAALGNYHGIRLLLANTTGAEVWFSATDSHLNIIQEALDSDGKWKAIEALPKSWCGNSYHRVRLGANEYWQLVAPRYIGGFTTKLRFRLGRDNEKPVYSNEIEGSVNRGQFVPIKNKNLF